MLSIFHPRFALLVVFCALTACRTVPEPPADAHLPILWAGHQLQAKTPERFDAADRLYALQYRTPMQRGAALQQRLDELASTGSRFRSYTKRRSLLAAANGTQALALRGLNDVVAVVPITPEHKLNPAMDPYLQQLDTELAELVVWLFPGTSSQAMVAHAQRLGGEASALMTLGDHPRLRLTLPRQQIEPFATATEVAWIGPWLEPILLNDVAARLIGTDHLVNTQLDGSGERIAIVDSGLDTGVADGSMHPDLSPQIHALLSYPVHTSDMDDIVNDGDDDGVADVQSGHGTHVSASALGIGAASNGVFTGTAPGADLILQAVEQKLERQDDDGTLSVEYGLQIPGWPELFDEARELGATLHSNSIGVSIFYNSYYDAGAQDSDAFVWDNPDALILFAAGNDGRDIRTLDETLAPDGVLDRCTLNTLATGRNVLAIGASETLREEVDEPYAGPYAAFVGELMADDPSQVAVFSGRGPMLGFDDDGVFCPPDNASRLKPDLVAPGTMIISAASSVAQDLAGDTLDTFGLVEATDPLVQRYHYLSGTSMATPLAAGAAARTRQFLRQELGIASPSAALVRALMVSAAQPLEGGSLPAPQPDSGQGWGRVNLADLVTEDFQAFELPALWPGQQVVFDLSLDQPASEVVLTMVYSDYFYSSHNLWHDLDLRLELEDGTLRHPNGRADPDRYNNVERLVLATLPAGGHRLVVEHRDEEAWYAQPAALVLRGLAEPVQRRQRKPIDLAILIDASPAANSPACEQPGGCAVRVYQVAKRVALDLLERWPDHSAVTYEDIGDRVAIIEYAGEVDPASPQFFPLSEARDLLIDQVQAIEPALLGFPIGSQPTQPVYPGKIALGGALVAAVQAFPDPERERHILVLGQGSQSLNPLLYWEEWVSDAGAVSQVFRTLKVGDQEGHLASNIEGGLILDETFPVPIHVMTIHSHLPTHDIVNEASEETEGLSATLPEAPAQLPDHVFERLTGLQLVD